MATILISEKFPPDVGGTSRWFWDLYSRLPAGEAMIVAGEREGGAEFDAMHPLPVYRMPLPRAEWGLLDRPARGLYRRAIRSVRTLSEEFGARRLHAARAIPEGWIAMRSASRLGLPFVCSAHGEEFGSALKSRQLRWMTRRVLRRADLLIANSTHTAGLLAEEWDVPRGRIEVVYPGTDVSVFVPAPTDARAKERLGWSGRAVVLTVSRLQKRKGHDTMVEALEAVRRRVPAVLWAVVGDGEERSALQAAVARRGLEDHVRFYGELSDEEMIAAYQQCDLFALPGREVKGDFEGFGIVLLEAQACARPVVVGDSGGSSEAVDAGRTARIVDCRSPEPLAEVLAELLESPELRQSMGERGRRWAAKRFPIERSVERLGEVLQRVGTSEGELG